MGEPQVSQIRAFLLIAAIMFSAPSALSHISLGQRPRDSINTRNQALKARINEWRLQR
jgi:hypothetical protein